MPTTPSTPTARIGSVEVADVAVTRYAAASLIELLEHCDAFLRSASPAVHAELRDFLAHQPTRPDAGWLIDMLGFNALYLQGKLAHTDHTAAHAADTHTGQTGDHS
jgi:hypothetical protein